MDEERLMKKYVISNGWSDDNKGDSAIVDGLIRTLSKNESAEFTVVSSFSADSPHYVSSAGHLQSRHRIRLLPNPVFHRCPMRRMGKRRRLADLAKSIVLLMSPRLGALLLSEKQRESIAALRSADCVIGKGGHYLFGSGDLRGVATLYFNAYTLILAKRLGARTALSANSVGPFVGKWVAALARYCFSTLDAIQVRESESLRVLGRLGISRAKETFDTAFVIDSECLSTGESLPGEYVVLTARQWDFPYASEGASERYKKYLEALTKSAVFFAQNGFSIVLAPQVVGPTALEDDRVVNRLLKERIHAEGFSSTILDQDYSPGQLKCIYQNARFLIGTRFHSVILALAGGTPVIAISYHGPKAPGIMAQLGLSEYVLDIDTIGVEGILEKCSLLIEREAELRFRIADGVRAIEDKVNRDVKDLVCD